MNKILSVIIALTVLFSLNTTSVFATGGDGNVDGGGGDMGGGTSQNSWSPGNEGVRVTVVRSEDHKAVTTPIDLISGNATTTIFNFGKVSKLSYTNGKKLSPQKACK